MSKDFLVVGSVDPNSFFARVHISSAAIIGHRFIGGRLSRNAAKSREIGASLGVTGYESTAAAIEAHPNAAYAVVTTPNVDHAPPAAAFIEAGIPVLIEKPVTMTVAEALGLRRLSEEYNVPVGVAYTYQNFWAATLGGIIGRSGVLGRPITFNLQYHQGWQLRDLGIAQEWRQDPSVSGDFNCAGDILTHIAQLLRNGTGEEIESLVGAIQIQGPTVFKRGTKPAKRRLDDDSQAIVKLSGGATGVLKASQMMSGHLNNCRFTISFAKGTIEWAAEAPEVLRVHRDGGGWYEFVRGDDFRRNRFLAPHLKEIVTAPLTPGGHTAGFRDAIATMHYRFGLVIDEWVAGGKKTVPTNFRGTANLKDGVAGMQFLAALKTSVGRDDLFTKV